MNVARKHMEWQVKDKCGDRIVKIILERVQVTDSGQKPTKSHETLSSRKICHKGQGRSLRENASSPSSKPSSGSCPGPSNRPQRNQEKNYVRFFDGSTGSEEDDDSKSDASGSKSESNEESDYESQSSPFKQKLRAKLKATSSKNIATHVVTGETRHPQTQTKAIPCLQCDVCFKKYKTPLALENHIIRFHVVDKPFECGICCKSYLTKQGLRQHRWRIHKPNNSAVIDKPLKCGICCKSFLTELLFQKHDQRIHKHKIAQKKANNNNSISWLQCDLCPYKCASQKWLEYHIIQVHVVDKPFKCEICTKSFVTANALNDHARLTHTNKNFICKLCPTKSFKGIASLKKHAQTVHKGRSDHRDSETIVDKQLCPVCDTRFLTDTDLAKHLKKPKSKSVMKCNICSESVYTPCRLTLHRQNMHNENPVADGSRKYIKLKGIVESTQEKQGPHLEKTTESPASVKNQDPPKKFSCSVCSAFFSQRSDLDRHELQENHRCWKCPICAKVFTWQGDLKRHIQAVHSDARPFKCTYKECSKSYKELRVLKKHMDMHDPDSYYIECDVCSKKFGTRQSMKQHLVTHTDERPFPCKFCDSKYKFLRVANQHMKKCELRTADQRKKFAKFSSKVVQQAKTRKPKIFISGKWRKLTDQAVKLDDTAKATSTSTSELTAATTSLNGNGADSKLVKQEIDLKLIKQEVDFKLIKQEVDLKYLSDNSSDFDDSPEPAVSVAKLEIIPDQEMCTYLD